MAKYIETLVGSEGTILIEISDEEVVPLTRGDVIKASPSLDKVSEKAEHAFDRVIEITRMLAKGFGHKLREFESPRPEEVELEFGLKLDASADILVAKAGVEAQFVVTLKWKRATTS